MEEVKPTFMARKALATLVVGLTLVGFGVINWYVIELQPVQRGSKQKINFELEAGTSVTALARELDRQKIIRSASAFTWYVTLNGKRRSLEAGSYDLSPGSTIPEIATVLGSGRTASTTVTIPEGSDLFSIRQNLAKKGIDLTKFNSALNDKYTNRYLAGRQAGNQSLEGYLFPDSYQIAKQSTAHQLIQTMLDEFTRKVQTDNVEQSFAAEGLSLTQGLTLASIIEKEVPSPSDRAMVSGVFINRLKAGMPLESDVTVDYASKLKGQPFNLALDSPYNTYKIKGLPLGPICNPGIGSIRAAARPQASSHLYFLAGKDGKTHYADTFPQHQQNVSQYLR